MEALYLFVKWHYDYDKEGTWFDEEDGEDTYPLIQGARHSLPRLFRKEFEIRSVSLEDGIATAEIYADYHTTIVTEGKPVTAHASASYSAASDSVHQSLAMTLSIVRK